MNFAEQLLLRILNNIDGMFEGKKASEKFILFMLFPIIFGALSYLLAIPQTETILKKNVKLQQNFQNTINNNLAYLNSVKASNQKQLLELEIQKASGKIEDQFTIQEDAENKLLNIMYKQKPWADLLDFVSKSAKSKQINVLSIKTEKSTESENLDFESVNINITGSANFTNLMQFVNEIEKFGIFIQIKKIDVKLEKLLHFSMVINSRRMVL